MLLRTTQRLSAIPGSFSSQLAGRSSLHLIRSDMRSLFFKQQQARRQLATTTTTTRTIRIPPVPLALIGLGFTCLAIGLYDHFMSDIQKYPTTVRTPLRKALYYEHKDPALSLPYFQQAFEEALKPDNEMALDGAPLTGILIQWGTLLEKLGRLPEARQTLIMALRHLLGMENVPVDTTAGASSLSSTVTSTAHLEENRSNAHVGVDDNDDGFTATKLATQKAPDHAIFTSDWTRLPVMEQKKVVGLCLKLGDINAALHRDDEAEKCYVAGVEHLLSTSTTRGTYGNDDPSATSLFDKEHLPDWLTSTDVGVALATLGQFYASRRKYSYAIHLYLRALSLGGMDTCESTVLMNNLTESYVSMNEFKEAKMWAEKGIHLAQNPNTGKKNNDQSLCDESCGVLLYNLGMIFEQTQDKEKAIQMYQQAIEHSRQHEQMVCVQQALKARKRVEYEVAREQQAKVA